ncbi:MAG TPA: glycosyltransferase family 39 protein [Fimbriiglobus sp.]|jgi:4-amino-4-deoxy-L-arabinose transferase-like glycosyltransferase|nr:glycosyltransferase family 39 protein [Fimbriiglobus sp.]
MATTLELTRPIRAMGHPTTSNLHLPVYALIAAFAVANLLYLLVACPLDLAPDEAHYWDWSRRLDWSYYSKGPLVAWLIRGSCALLGDTMPAVRLPAVLCNALLLVAVHRLTVQTFRSDRLALAAVALGLSIPPLAAPAVLMTIDGPFLCCWAWACVFAQRRAWAAAGLVAAVGVLAKYTMLLFPVCVGLYLLTDHRRRGLLLRPGYWVLCGLTALGLVPIVAWNAANDWVSVRHVVTLAGADEGSGFDPLALPHYLGSQFGLLIGYWFLAWVAAICHFRPWRRGNPRTAFLWWASVPVFAVFLLAAVKSKGQANWPAAAYVSGAVLAVAWVVRQVSDPDPRHRRLACFFLAVAVPLGVVMTLAARFPGLVRPLYADLAPAPTAGRPVPIRKLDLTSRMHGWRSLATVVDELREQARTEDGEEPVLAGMTWTIPGELAFYCRGHPTAYTFGPALADRHSQYDLWRPNPIANAQVFRGRTFVYVGDITPEVQQAFDRVDPPVEVVASDGGTPVADWRVRVLRGFRGFPNGKRGAGY